MNWTDERNQPQARVLLDSISPDGVQLTTFEVTTHRFVLAELNTHRVFSRNSASSRAIPITKRMDEFSLHPADPVEWASEQRGMQGGTELTGQALEDAQRFWWRVRNVVAGEVNDYLDAHPDPATRLHKSLLNRWLEPALWHNVIVTATEWDGFWEQRCSPLAQPEIRVAAEAMRAAYEGSVPTPLGHGGWHTPLIQPDDDFQTALEDWDFCVEEAGRRLMADHPDMEQDEHDRLRMIIDAPVLKDWTDVRKAVSAARCARVSYLTHDGTRDIIKDLELYARLATARPGHWSPFEHVATPCNGHKVRVETDTPHAGGSGFYMVTGEHLGNFRGWDQYRHEVSTGANA